MISAKSLKQIVIYFFVGLGATLVEWSAFYIFDVRCGIHYTWSTSLAFVISTFANWGLGRIMLFHSQMKQGLLCELAAIYGISCIGLIANLAIMFICISGFGFSDIIAKMLATVIVFIGNFVVRKFLIYKI